MKATTRIQTSLTTATNGVESSYTSFDEKATTPASVTIVQNGTNLEVNSKSVLTTTQRTYSAPRAAGTQAVIDRLTVTYPSSVEGPEWRKTKK